MALLLKSCCMGQASSIGCTGPLRFSLHEEAAIQCRPFKCRMAALVSIVVQQCQRPHQLAPSVPTQP